MAHRFVVALASAGLGLIAAPAGAQPGPLPAAIPHPTYYTMTVETDVSRPAQAVWARVGGFCAIADWEPATCSILSGVDGQPGAVRLVHGTVVEMLVARTGLSYTYARPVHVGEPYDAYHGTLEVQPVTASTSKLVYSFFYDNSMLKDDAARAAEAASRRSRVVHYLNNMKVLAEGGTLPPPH